MTLALQKRAYISQPQKFHSILAGPWEASLQWQLTRPLYNLASSQWANTGKYNMEYQSGICMSEFYNVDKYLHALNCALCADSYADI